MFKGLNLQQTSVVKDVMCTSLRLKNHSTSIGYEMMWKGRLACYKFNFSSLNKDDPKLILLQQMGMVWLQNCLYVLLGCPLNDALGAATQEQATRFYCMLDATKPINWHWYLKTQSPWKMARLWTLVLIPHFTGIWFMAQWESSIHTYQNNYKQPTDIG